MFAEYAASGAWKVVHLGQFIGMAISLAGLFGLAFALDARGEIAKWAGRMGAGSAAAALALYGTLQAVDGVALKQTVDAWASAPDAEKAVRFASAEETRWLEWGMRSYQDYLQGLALILFAAAVVRSEGAPQSIAYLMALTGLAFLAQGWVAGSEGFSQTQSILIVLAWALSLVWMIWLAVAAWRTRVSEQG